MMYKSELIESVSFVCEIVKKEKMGKERSTCENYKDECFQNKKQVNESCLSIRVPMGPKCIASSQLHFRGVNFNVLF